MPALSSQYSRQS